MTFEEWEQSSGDVKSFQEMMNDQCKRARSLGVETIIMYRVEDKLSNLSEYGMVRGCDLVVAAGLIAISGEFIGCESVDYEE